MSEMLNARLEESSYFKFLKQTFDVVMEFSISTLRFYMGFMLSDSFINCNAFISWCVEVSLAEFCLNHFIKSSVENFYPKILNSAFFDFFFPKLLSLWIVSLLFHQSLLVLLFSQALYWLFTFYSKLFSRLLVESLTLFYYYQNPWIIFPIVINLLFTILYFVDSIFQSGILNFIGHFPFFQHLLKEWGIAIIEVKPYENENLDHESTQLPGLTHEEHLQYIVLKNRYISQLNTKVIKEHFETLRAFLADEYYAHQAFYTDKKNHVHVLPLDWREFEKLSQKFPAHERIAMLKSYYTNPYHSAWRMLSTDNHWGGNDVKSLDCRKKLFLDKHIEFILTVWMAIKNEHSQSKHPDVIKIKSDMFIKVLANTNRFRNLHLHRGRREMDMDDMHADKMGDIKLLLCTLLPVVGEKHSDKYLTLGILKKFLDSYVKSLWIEHFLFSEGGVQRELSKIWKNICKRESFFYEYENNMSILRLTPHHKEDFLVKMNTLYGRGWLQKKEFLNMVNDYFENHEPHLQSYLNEVSQEMDFIVTRQI